MAEVDQQQQQLPEGTGPDSSEIGRQAMAFSMQHAPEEPPPDDDDDEGGGSDGAASADQDKDDQQDAAEAKDGGRKVLKSRDGKHEIPYSRLEEAQAARDKATADAEAARKEAEETARELAETKARLEALEKAQQQGTATTEQASQATADLEAQIAEIEQAAAALREDGAEFAAEQQEKSAKVLRAMLANQRALEQRITEDAKARKEREEQDEQQAVRKAVGEALEKNPAILFWQKEKPAFFEDAKRRDDALLAKAEWKDKPISARFKAVVDSMVAEYGTGILPKSSGDKPSPAKPGKELPKVDALGGVNTLTDLPGGAPAAANSDAALDEADITQVSDRLMKMDNPDDIARFVTSRRR